MPTESGPLIDFLCHLDPHAEAKLLETELGEPLSKLDALILIANIMDTMTLTLQSISMMDSHNLGSLDALSEALSRFQTTSDQLMKRTQLTYSIEAMRRFTEQGDADD